MSKKRSNQLRASYTEEEYVGDEPPDLGPLRALAEREELADAVGRLADSYGHRLRADDPLARDIARALTEAGFTLHHCTHPAPSAVPPRRRVLAASRPQPRPERRGRHRGVLDNP
ncbi:MAG TPA: hypothetical protein VIK57_25290 [Streptosporangiaceae bacterium]